MKTEQNLFGKKVIETALSYANHKWYASEKNVMHGRDADGRYVDTPDISWRGKELHCGWWKVNQYNTGIPYSWGNASTLEEFDMSIREGKCAGNVPEDKSRVFSCKTVGVDCSGLLSVCWELPERIKTKDIPDVALPIESIDEIRHGDVFALPGSHVMIFKEFLDDTHTRVSIIDAARSTGKVSQREFAAKELLKRGYKIYRYR